MPVLGVISDTHGLLRPEAIHALTGSGLIIHAGDVGSPDILSALSELAPVIAVKGNVDTAEWAQALPTVASVEFGGKRVYVIHNRNHLGPSGPPSKTDIVISGHSHKPSRQFQNGILYLNPGSAGRRRFTLPVCVATIQFEEMQLKVHFHGLLTK